MKDKQTISPVARTPRLAPTVLLAVGLVILPLTITNVADAQNFSVIFDFNQDTGQRPTGDLVSDSSGNLYGMTTYGGANGYGSVFELPTTGGEVDLYSFSGRSDGAYPEGASLIQDAQGNLYGVASFGGNFKSTCPAEGCGVVFRLSLAGEEKVLYRFTGASDGSVPVGGLLRDAAGNLYGTAAGGGNFNTPCGSYGCGVVFEIEPGGKETALYGFSGGSDGYMPLGGVVRDAAGNLYGTAEGGGAFGSGVVFMVDEAGRESALYAFTGGADGLFPTSGVIRDSAGDLYGTTPEGGDSSCPFGCGVVFKIDPSGDETVLCGFTSRADGYGPSGGLLRDEEGNLYGTTAYGGSYSDESCATDGCGVVYRVSSAGKEKVLHSFGGTDGDFPLGRLTPYNGYLYGATQYGGSEGFGVAFRLNP